MKLITANLVHELQQLSNEAVGVSWITAFAMKSGVKLMLPTLQRVHNKGTDIQLLVGDYLSITQPDALQMLVDALPKAEIRLFKTHGQSFHPKAYLFRHEHTQHVIVGSSNLSKSALTTGVEWNLHTVNAQTFEQAIDEFQKVFYAENTVPLNTFTIEQYRKIYDEVNRTMPLSKQWDDSEATNLMYGVETGADIIYEEREQLTVLEPRPAQKLALKALNETKNQGYDKAMVVMATGLGKTYLAAFFAKLFNRVLFVAHRDEILEQAKGAFTHVYPNKKAGFYNGVEKNLDADMTFASIYTLGQKQHLQKFNVTAFDLIVVDEFHHAAAPTYNRLIEYFKPNFLLGITATPDRLDNKDVYAICDGNVAFEIHFFEAIAHKWLSPFHYYGVKDEIDYSQIRWVGTHYDETQLVEQQLQQSVIRNIYGKWLQLKQTRTIGFCSSVKQATRLAEYFREQGVKAVALTGTNSRSERRLARQQLISGAVDIIFTVDLFNEGVDIPAVDTLLFIRPTESIAIFTQQIGRGLRIADNKEKCVIIDFIGNYRNADRKLKLLHPQLIEKGKLLTQPVHTFEESGVVLNFDLEVIDLLKEIVRKGQTLKQQIIQAYENVKTELGHRPTYLELYLQSGYEDLNVAKEFGSFVHLLEAAEELTVFERGAFEQAKSLIIEIEKTAMTKSYKMVLLRVMLERGSSNWYKPIEAKQVAQSFANYLAQPTNRIIDSIDLNENKVITLLQNMPMTKWSGSSKGLASFEDKQFKFNVEIDAAYESVIYDWVYQICEFRLHRYFAKKAK